LSSCGYNDGARRFFDNLCGQRIPCSVFRVRSEPRRREVRERCGPCSKRVKPLSTFRFRQVPRLRVGLRFVGALHSTLALRVVRAPGGAHRGWDPGRVFSVRAPRFSHQEQVQSGGNYQRSAISRQPEGRLPPRREEREGVDSCFGRRLPVSDFRLVAGASSCPKLTAES
jgi:hypothetical protein